MFLYLPSEWEAKVTVGEGLDGWTLSDSHQFEKAQKWWEVPGWRRVNLSDSTMKHFQVYWTGQVLFVWSFSNPDFALTLARRVKKPILMTVLYGYWLSSPEMGVATHALKNITKQEDTHHEPDSFL